MTQIFGNPIDRSYLGPVDQGKKTQTPIFYGGLLIGLATALIMVGVVMVFSTSGSLDKPFWPDNPLQSPAVRQLAFVVIGIISLWASYGIGYRCLHWRGELLDDAMNDPRRPVRFFQPAAILLIVTIICLVVVLIPGIGIERNGARRWLQFGPAQYGIGFQPSEMAKLSVILFLSSWLANRQAIMHRFLKGLLPAVCVVAVASGLIVLEDLGTAAIITLVGGMLILASGARWWHALIVALPGVLGFVGMIVAKPYRLERIASYQDIWADPLGKGYHAIQSLVAISSGGWQGRGIGGGLQKYGYLPEAKTDFIFSIICEEMGLLGGMVLLCLFLCLALLGWRIMARCHDLFGKLLAMGVTLLIGFQAVMNVSVVTVAIPTKGISLPLVSAGGSGIIFYSIAIGLLASVDKQTLRQLTSPYHGP